MAAVIIASQQLKLAKYRMKLDLFDKRFATFMKLREFVSEVAIGVGYDPGAFYRGTVERRFLFTDPEVSAYFDEVYERAKRVVRDDQALGRPNLAENERHEIVERLAADKEWFFNQSDEMFRVFFKDLSIKTLE